MPPPTAPMTPATATSLRKFLRVSSTGSSSSGSEVRALTRRGRTDIRYILPTGTGSAFPPAAESEGHVAHDGFIRRVSGPRRRSPSHLLEWEPTPFAVGPRPCLGGRRPR